ncbi:MAG: ABC transporter permease subunit [Clostridium sp.]|nr:ABC transporter permease subunit [Clostridium sp.]
MRERMINAVLFLLAAVILLPCILLIVWAVTKRWAWPDLIPQKFSFRAVKEVSGRRVELFRVFFSSVLISTAVAVLSAVIGVMTCRALVFYDFFGKRLLGFLTVLPFMVPSTVFAMGIQLTFIRLGLNNTVSGVILAHLICSLPYAVRLIMDGTRALGRGLEEQARVLGASPWQAFFRVALPVLAPVVLSAASMAYVVSFSQYFLTLMIGGGQVKTFSIVMVPYLQSGDRSIASVYSVLFLAVTLSVFGLYEWIGRRWTKDSEGGFYE